MTGCEFRRSACQRRIDRPGIGVPFQIPKSDALLAMEIRTGGYQLIAHAGLKLARTGD